MLFGALAVVIIGFGYQQFFAVPTEMTGVEVARLAADSPDTAVAIAALPFANLSGDPEQEYFADGITDEISSALAGIPDLNVVARRSAYQFKGQNIDMQTIGEALGATHLIDGSVRRDGDRVRITAQLIDVGSGTEIWGDVYDRVFADVFDIQEDIATSIASALNTQLGLAPGESLVFNRTDDPEIYQDYLRARALVGARSLEEARLLLNSIVERDPNYVGAWALLTTVYAFLRNRDPDYAGGSIEEAREVHRQAMENAEMAATEAMRLDPNYPGAIAAQGMVDWWAHGRFTAAEDRFRAALALDPTNPQILDSFMALLALTGRLEESAQISSQLLQFERFVPSYRINTAAFAVADGPDEGAIRVLETTDTDDPFFDAIRSTYLAKSYAELGRYSEAADTLLAIRFDLVSPQAVEAAARALRSVASGGSVTETLPSYSHFLNFVYGHVGTAERVMEWPERQIGIQGYGEFGAWSPTFSDLRQTDRFRIFVRNSGLLDYWRERGFADLCRPVGEDDFECD